VPVVGELIEHTDLARSGRGAVEISHAQEILPVHEEFVKFFEPNGGYLYRDMRGR
jgi:hypothetical protein